MNEWKWGGCLNIPEPNMLYLGFGTQGSFEFPGQSFDFMDHPSDASDSESPDFQDQMECTSILAFVFSANHDKRASVAVD